MNRSLEVTSNQGLAAAGATEPAALRLMRVVEPAGTTPPAVSPALLRQLIQAERTRFDRLLAVRTAEIKRIAERQLNDKIATTDRRLKSQVQSRLLQVKHQQEALLGEARRLQARERALAEQTAAFEAEKAALRADLQLTLA